jgi:hypothetical protein
LLAEANLKVKPKKVSFAKNEVRYLGHIVTSEGMRPNPSKVAAITELNTPQNLKEVRQFLGLVGYYRQYIGNFASIAAPLYALTKKDAEFKFGDKEKEAFELLKGALVQEPILRRPSWDLPFIVQTDASINGLGAILSQRTDCGDEYAVAYASRALSAAEKDWSAHEWEALAIIWAAETFRPYLYGQRFYVETDSLDLTWLRQTKKGGRLMRWGLRLSDFDFEI